MSLDDAVLIQQSIRKGNLKIWVAQLCHKGLYTDLDVLVPKQLQTAKDIPQTLIYVEKRLEANTIAQYLRTKLPHAMQSQGSKIIRAYSAPLDEISKQEMRIGLKNESVRIAVCTEGLGMGVDIRTITRVVQYRLDSTVDIRNLYQRFGHAGRDPSTIGLALVFVTTTNLRT